MADGWSFAASANTVGGLPKAIQGSFEHAMATRNFNDDTVAQISATAKALIELLQTGLWGVGPYSVTFSGTSDSVFLSVKSEPRLEDG